MSENGFYSHIQEAITINRHRKKLYSKLSKGKTRKLSNALIISEMMTRPLAKYYDKKAKVFNEQGIMVVKADFVDMDIADYDSEVPRRSAWTSALHGQLKTLINEYISIVPRKSKSISNLKIVLDKGIQCYRKVGQLELEFNVHSQMTKHMLESICFIAKNGIDYAEQSQGQTLSISGALVKWHKVALKNSLWMDRWGNKFHQNNIGILINDMPTISINS